MRLLEDLREMAERSVSPFAAQLIKEDLARLGRVMTLVSEEPDSAAFRKKAMMLGWTQGDLRTFELNPELELFLDAVYGAVPGTGDGQIAEAWAKLHRRRMDLLVGCLSRPRIDER